MKLIIILLISFFLQNGLTAERGQVEELRQGPSASLLNQITSYNQNLSLFPERSFENEDLGEITTFAEYTFTKYLVFSDENRYGSKDIKKGLAQNLPEESKLIVYTQNSSEAYAEKLFREYSQYIDEKRLIVLRLPKGGRTAFWSRDNTPLAVFQDGSPNLVDARYYYNFEPDQDFGRLFGLNILSHDYFYEGGNYTANAKGDCIVVNRRRRYPYGTSDTAAIPDSIFKNLYGCKNLIRLKHLKGIGHSDEVVKFLDDQTIVTDTESYAELLKEQGFKVHLLPEPRTSYGTYVNSLMVNKVLYVPVYNEAGDQKAIDLYQKLLPEHKIVPLFSGELSRRGQGGVHCITMNYPDVPLADIKNALLSVTR